MLKCQDVAIAHGANTLFSGLTLNLYPKHVVGVVGANGCGKSSLFSAILTAVKLRTAVFKSNLAPGLIACNKKYPP